MDTLLISCLQVTIKHNIGFQDFKLFTEWLGCYNDLRPIDRELVPELVTYLMRNRSVGIEVFKSYLLCDIITTVATKQIQERLLCKLLIQE